MTQVKFTILSENHAVLPSLRAEHGLSVYVETPSANLLFDTGASRLFLDNARALRLELFGADYIALSHGHSDHSGGLSRALSEASQARLCLHPDALHQKFSRKKRKLRPIGLHDDSLSAYVQALGQQRVSFVEKTMTLSGELLLFQSGPLLEVPPDWRYFTLPPGAQDEAPDHFSDEISLLCQGENAAALICGCAHPGLPSIFEKASTLSSKPITSVIGGSHLQDAALETLNSFADFFRQHNCKLMLGHCTGLDSYARLRPLLREGQLEPLYAGLQFDLDL
ncbi:MAG: hypothetical protein A2X49_00350 [Lentisphaerae bacterium GWF2_52_8]|nr:MAG: hypothetical protein A2X49_00350 [Lentisphaerae bacterium GWF2_52_8]